MSETANAIVKPAVEEKSNALNTEQDKPTTNDVVKESKKKEASTPAIGKRRKRASEAADSSLVIATPSGTDANRRQTRSQTRGTPAPSAPTPAKKPALEKTSNGSAKGRRGRPPKSASEEKPAEAVIPDQSSKDEEEEEETKEEPSTSNEVNEEAKEENVEQKIERKLESKETESVDGVSTSKEENKATEEEASVNKEEESKPEANIDPIQNSQEPEKPKEKVVTSVEKDVTETGDKPAEGDNKIVNNASPDTTVNNHEQA